ncbi:MAG: hypothetical protein AABX31_05155 [Nanoarchaeota archaeon]
MTKKNLEKKVDVVDFLQGKYKVQGPDGREYDFQVTGEEEGELHDHTFFNLVLSYNGSVMGGIYLLPRTKEGCITLEEEGRFEDIAVIVSTDPYKVRSNKDNSPAEEINPLDYLLREVTKRLVSPKG